MRIVIDTNLVISGVFFGGYPKKIIEIVKEGKIKCYATLEIVEEYKEIIEEMIIRKQGNFNAERFNMFTDKLQITEPADILPICRDPDDDKFIACAKAASAKYIVSGDKDLLCLEKYDDIEIITAKEFYVRHFE